MRVCCNPATSPSLILLDGHHAIPAAGVHGRAGPGEKLLAVPLSGSRKSSSLSQADSGQKGLSSGSVPPLPLKDIVGLISNLGLRLEELFRKLMEEQREVQSQLLTMQASLRVSTEAQLASQQGHQLMSDKIHEIQTQLLSVQGVSSKAHEIQSQFESRPSSKVRFEEPEGLQRAGDLRLPGRLTQMATASSTSMTASSVATESIATEVMAPICNHHKISVSAEAIPGRMSDEVMKNTIRARISDGIGSGSTFGLKFSQDWSLTLRSRVGIDGSLSSRIRSVLKSKEFEIAIAFIIIMNGFVLCWECQYIGLELGYSLKYPTRNLRGEAIWPGAEHAFTFLDWLFGILFLLELFVKLCSWRFKYFYAPVQSRSAMHNCKNRCGRRLKGLQGWNLLDSCCVTAFISDKMLGISSIDPKMLRMLRLARLFRLARLLPILETLDQLYVMTTAIAALHRVLTWAVILISIMLSICNLFLVQILQATYFGQVSASDLNEESLRKHHRMYEYFGTWSRCMLSMFEITLGNWPPVARLLSEEVSEWFTLVCVIHKLTIGFAVIGVITGIILQETFKVAQTDDVIMFRQKRYASRTLHRKLKTLFDALDRIGDGRIHQRDFKAICENPEINIWLASLDIETDDLSTLFSLIDVDGSGYITVDELVARLPRIRGAARSIDMLAMMQQFRNHQRCHNTHEPMAYTA